MVVDSGSSSFGVDALDEGGRGGFCDVTSFEAGSDGIAKVSFGSSCSGILVWYLQKC